MKNRLTFQLIAFVAFISLFFACKTEETATKTAYTNAKIYTSNPQQEWAEAMIVENGKIVKIGTITDIKNAIDKNTKEVDVQGKFIMAGLIDAHVHPVFGGSQALFYCKIPMNTTADSLKQILQNYVKEKKPAILLGGQWANQFFTSNPQITNPKEWLDAIVPDIPVLLQEYTLHAAWVNSKALALLKPDKNNIYFEKDKKGEFNGILQEEEAINSFYTIAKWSDEQLFKIIDWSQNEALSYGITALKDAILDEDTKKALVKMDHAGKLKLFYAGCIQTPYGVRNKPLDAAIFIERSKAVKSPHTNFNFAKFFMDGVPTSARTAAMIHNYVVDADHKHPSNGSVHINEDVLFEDIKALDAQNIVVKIHCAGDRSVKIAINAIERVRKANGNKNNRHEIGHTSFIAPEDRLRLKDLNIVAELSPYIWFPSPLMDNIIQNVGEEVGKTFWPIHTLDSLQVPIAAGSDWPAAVQSIDPWIGIEAMVTRKNPYGTTGGEFIPQEKIDLKSALRIFTAENAKAIQKEKEYGMLKEHYYANFIILDKNLFDIPADDISDIKILETFFEGKSVFQHKGK